MNWMDLEPEAFTRGHRDGSAHWPLVKSGLRGRFIKDAIPSNPFNEAGDPHKWQAYNAGFHYAYGRPRARGGVVGE